MRNRNKSAITCLRTLPTAQQTILSLKTFRTVVLLDTRFPIIAPPPAAGYAKFYLVSDGENLNGIRQRIGFESLTAMTKMHIQSVGDRVDSGGGSAS